MIGQAGKLFDYIPFIAVYVNLVYNMLTLSLVTCYCYTYQLLF